MTMKKNIIISIAAVILAAVSTGCSVDESGIYGSFPYLEVELESKTLTKVAASDAIAIKTNRKVTASVVSQNGAWLNVSVEGEQLVLTWNENQLETPRTATITLSTPNSLVTKTIEVVQDASGELTFDGDLILRSKAEIAENTYTKVTGDLIIGNVTSIVSKATESSVSIELGGKNVTASPSDISDEDMAVLAEQIHKIGGGCLAVINTEVTEFPVEIISQNQVTTVNFDYNAMSFLPSAGVMESLGLKSLSVKGNTLKDITALSGCSAITYLDISGNDVYNLDPIKEMEGLQTVVMDNLPISAPQLEIFKEQCANLEVIADDIRPEASPLPVFGTLDVTELSDTKVQLIAYLDANASDITKAGFYIGNKRVLDQQTWHDADYSDGVLSMTYEVETLENIIYYVRAYAENAFGGDYSKAGFFGSMTSEEDVYIKSMDELQQFYDDTYSHVNGSVFVGRTYESGSSGVKLDDGKYSMYFRSTDMSDLSKLSQLVFVRDGLYIGNVGLSDLNYISHIEGMQTLWLRANEFSKIPELASAPTLTYLDVSMNNLSDISFLEKMPALETLKLGSSDKPQGETNDIGLIDGLAEYTNLKHIDLSGLPLHQWQVDELKEQMPDAEIVFTSGGRDPHIPTVKAERVVRTESTVTMKATVISKGKSDIVEYGFYYGKDTESLEKITVEQSSISVGETFSHTVDVQDTDIYYWYPYAVNAQGETRCALNEFTLAYEDLSQTGTANSYLIQTSGKYKFNATVRGNSLVSVGNPVDVEVLWEFSNPTSWDSIISSVALNEGYVEFEIREDVSYGNALIAVKDSQGTILWSWHIWLCDFDPDASARKTKNGMKLMDRNLGATLSEFNGYDQRDRASGMLYQWGRKDPMNQLVITGYRPGFSYPSVEMASSEPTTFAQNWIWFDDGSGNGVRGLWSAERKTMYDPCPQGWKVADRSAWDGGHEFTGNYDEYGTWISHTSDSDALQYPYAPYYDSNMNYINWESRGYIWTTELDGDWYAYDFRYEGTWSTVYDTRCNGDALPVRCMKDVGFVVTTSDVKPGTDKATVFGKVESDGTTAVSERGFVFSSNTSAPDINNATKVAAGAGSGEFSALLESLGAETDYWVRAYAVGDDVVRYGTVVHFRTAKSGTGGDDFTEDDYVWE